MNHLRYAMCAILALGDLGHLYGTFDGYQIGSEVFVWSLSGAAFVAAVVVLNLFASSGRRVHLVAAALAAGVWSALALGFGSSVGNVLDPRALAHAVPAAILVIVNVKTLLGSARKQGPVSTRGA